MIRMDIVIAQVRQQGRKLILESDSVIGYQHSAKLYIKLIRDTSESDPFAGMILSGYCRNWQSTIPAICPIEKKKDGTYILLSNKAFETAGTIYLSLGGINEDKVVVTTNNLILQVDESNSVYAKQAPSEKYWEIEVLNAMKVWYANVVDKVFKANEVKLNQLIRRSEEHMERTQRLHDLCNSTVSEINRKLANDEFRGPQGIQGIQGEKGDKGDTGESGITTPVSGMYTLSVDADGNLYANYNDEAPVFSYDSETGALYYEI